MFLKRIIRYKDMLYEAFLDFLDARDKLELNDKVGYWLQRTLGISTYGLYFSENDMITTYKNLENKKFISFSNTQGIAGFVLQNQKSCIVTDIKNSVHYNKLVDVISQFPLYACPLIEYLF